MFASDYQLFWHRHRKNPVFTEEDWRAFERAKENAVKSKANRAVARMVANLRFGKKK